MHSRAHPTSDLLIRPVSSGDFVAITALVNHYIQNTTIHFGTTPVTPVSLHQDWLASKDTYPFLVATTKQGAFAGFARAYKWRVREAYATTAETGIYITSHFQNRSVGLHLYAALIDAARLADLHSLIGVITLPNDPSIRLHQRLGFKLAGTFPRAGSKFGQWLDVAFYQLMLHDATHISKLAPTLAPPNPPST